MRLSLRIAIRDEIRIVATAIQAKISEPWQKRAASGPNTYNTTRSVQNAPAFTTATACSNALTGVGATMAAGSQL